MGAATAFYLCAGCVFVGGVTSSLALRTVSDRVIPSSLAPLQHEEGNQKWNLVALLLLLGYIAHCWELLGSWTWTPSLIYAALLPYQTSPVINSMLIATIIHLSGLFSTLIVGTLSDYFNRTTVLIVMGGMGGLCSLLTGWSVTWEQGGSCCVRSWEIFSFWEIQAYFLHLLQITLTRKSWEE